MPYLSFIILMNEIRYLRLHKVTMYDLQEVSKQTVESPLRCLTVQGPEQPEHALS